MTTEVAEKQERIFTNSRGFKVPESEMQPQDVLKHDLIMENINKAIEYSAQIDAFKRKVFKDIHDFIALLADHYNTDTDIGKGNMNFTSYCQRYQIKIGVSDVIQFGVEIDIAKKIIGEVIQDELGETSDFLKEIVNDAFQTDKQGHYNKTRIMALRKYRRSCDHPKWGDAMRALDDGIIAGSTKTYITFHQRNEFGKWEQITLASKSL